MKAPTTVFEILCLLGRRRLSDADAARLADAFASPAFDGDALLTEAERHGLMPLTYRHLIAEGDFDLPPALRERLMQTFRAHAISRFAYARRLRELLALLSDAGIPALPYKGPALAIQVYGHYAARQYGDIDILVRPEQAVDALRALLDAGLRQGRPLPPQWDRHLRRLRHSYEVRDPQTGVTVDLHWALADRYQDWDLTPEWLMQDGVTVNLLGAPVRAMNPERQLLALTVHGTRHLWERLAWLAEVAELIRANPDLDWDLVFAQARHIGFARALRVSLLLMRALFEVSPPEPRMSAVMRDRVAQRLADELLAQLRSEQGVATALPDKFRFGWRVREGLIARLRFAWSVASQPSENDMRHRHGSPFVAWLARPLRLGRKGLSQWRRARGH
ncbi:MAG: nucleotidyltransferase family protein [Ectothiorhodospiraceae bacterium]|nr:nucleotidyltransferase family protein [Ectothiorhodospiraceae bacterium]